MDRIYPLAVPKGRRLCCEVGLVHQRADWSSIHEKICQLLIPLRTSMPFYNSEEERRHGLQQLQQRQKHLIEFCYTVAQKYLFEGKHEAAVPAALHSLRFRMSVHGLSSVELVPAYLLLAEASLGLGQIVQAEEYLSQAQWTVLKSTECCYATQSLLHRNLGLLSIAKENYEEARYHLANDIYFASCAFGTEDIRTSGGYFHLANIFYGLKKLDLADTLYTKIAEIWSKYLNNRYQVLSQNRIQQIDLLGKRFETDTGLAEAEGDPKESHCDSFLHLGPKKSRAQDSEREKPETVATLSNLWGGAGLVELPVTTWLPTCTWPPDEAQEAEAIQILTSIWNIRESTSNTDPQKTIFVLKILVMLYYLMMNSSKAQEYAMRAFSLAKEQHLSVNEQSTIEDLLNMISAEEAHPIT
ncbi:zinc finger MYND domain-containing protein 12 isoform X2 [Canis lupus dingo]|uniref:zinc finger MYND domain-containing protein 12 isoform X2 n=1 Tax=Canis lupus dingo TaxID=286419 RepID=UPI0020C56576|nr:zinc finger MYND domain-containing protein 12 isoform X2 [Canis lupus dingo]